MAWSNIGFVAEDRVHSGLFGLLVELECSIEIPMVSNRAGVHAQFLDLFEQVRNLAGPVEQRVVGVAVQVGKRAGFAHGRIALQFTAQDSRQEVVKGESARFSPLSR